MILKQFPGDQVYVIPEWALNVIKKKGQIADLLTFSKMRQWFNQEQLVALGLFSQAGVSTLWGHFGSTAKGGQEVYHRSLSYAWFFPEDCGVAANGNDTDRHALSTLSRMIDEKSYSEKVMDEHITDYLRQSSGDAVDLSQSYSVFIASPKIVLLVLNQGILSAGVQARAAELRLMVFRSVMEKLYELLPQQEAHKSPWFNWYLSELERLK